MVVWITKAMVSCSYRNLIQHPVSILRPNSPMPWHGRLNPWSHAPCRASPRSPHETPVRPLSVCHLGSVCQPCQPGLGTDYCPCRRLAPAPGAWWQFRPGGGTDVVARAGRSWPATAAVVIDNKPGASTIIGALKPWCASPTRTATHCWSRAHQPHRSTWPCAASCPMTRPGPGAGGHRGPGAAGAGRQRQRALQRP